MSRQLDQEQEQRESRRRVAVVKALEFGLAGGLESQGIHLTGFAVKFDAWDCLITLRAIVENVPCVAFVGSDSIINCLLKVVADTQNNKLRWREDKYKSSGS